MHAAAGKTENTERAYAMDGLLELKNVTKIYEGGVLANHNISLAVKEGEIHALVGENGAGKSTLMRILFGMESITSGQIFLRGQEVRFSSSKDAIAHGIGMVHQHFMLVDSFTGAENMMLGLTNTRFISDKAADIRAANAVADKYGFKIDISRRVRDMSVGMKQKLEILKILYRGCRILILDEPTAVLTPQETEELFERLISLKQDGMTIIFISHKLNEVKRISDRITVLKGGRTMGTYSNADLTEEQIANLMVGRAISFEYEKPALVSDRTLLRTEDLTYMDRFGVMKLNGVSLSVNNYEIVGIAGVEGNGQSELVEIVTANLRPLSGRVLFEGRDITNEDIGAVRKHGVSYIPEDRMHDGCADPMSVQENMIVSDVDSYSNRLGLLNAKKIRAHCRGLIRDFSVKTSGEDQPIRSLSGGNIQKVIVAREFSAPSDLLVLNQPTRGVDIGAISFIHHKILEMRNSGKGVLFVSADLSELIALSDRILVIYKGRIAASLDNSGKVSEQELGLYMLGIKQQTEAV
ncbi:MAG TPA: ABC transporter ATP-binding protein [Feifaniaceae bacterium]|nr:ABC transporter ATP-binding protein [Feifaniaceae bacterium]